MCNYNTTTGDEAQSSRWCEDEQELLSSVEDDIAIGAMSMFDIGDRVFVDPALCEKYHMAGYYRFLRGAVTHINTEKNEVTLLVDADQYDRLSELENPPYKPYGAPYNCRGPVDLHVTFAIFLLSPAETLVPVNHLEVGKFYVLNYGGFINIIKIINENTIWLTDAFVNDGWAVRLYMALPLDTSFKHLEEGFYVCPDSLMNSSKIKFTKHDDLHIQSLSEYLSPRLKSKFLSAGLVISPCF